MVRADARENRARILEAARQALAGDGGTSMNQIAQRAGVGPGTLYRNFPTREALVLAVYQLEVDQLIDSVRGLLAALPPLEALRHWTTDLVSAMRKKHGLGDALSPGAQRSITERTYDPVIAAITQLLEAGQQTAPSAPTPTRATSSSSPEPCGARRRDRRTGRSPCWP